MENRSSKQILFAILGVLVLVVAVVGVSFAMFTFAGEGTKTNSISTGTLAVTYTESTQIALTSAYPEADATCSAVNSSSQNCGYMTFTIGATLEGTATINYSVYIDELVEGATLKDDNIRFSLYNQTASTQVVAISDLKDYTSTVAPRPAIATGTFTTNGSVTYVLRAWINGNDGATGAYTLPGTQDGNSLQTTQETLTFKVLVDATA